jgi:hypothetical protein
LVDKVRYEKKEPDFKLFCGINFRKFEQISVSSPHDQRTVSTSHDQSQSQSTTDQVIKSVEFDLLITMKLILGESQKLY